MCEFHNDLPMIADGEDQYILDTPVMRDFIAAVNAARAAAPSAAAAIEEIRPHFAALLADPNWLPPEYQEMAAQSGMGSNTGMWLLYRAGDGSLAFSVLVLGTGRETPVHDHLAWGLVGLYRGEQDEIVYQRRDDGSRDDFADLAVAEHNALTARRFLYAPAGERHPPRPHDLGYYLRLAPSARQRQWLHRTAAVCPGREGRAALPQRLPQYQVRRWRGPHRPELGRGP